MGDDDSVQKCNSHEKLGLMKLNDHKAGMQGLDTTKINQIIEEASKGSQFYQHKQKNQERIDAKIANLKAACAKLTEEQKKSARAKVYFNSIYKFDLLKQILQVVHYIADGQFGTENGRDEGFVSYNGPCGHGRILCRC